jgi:hypothetical protein
MTSKLPFDFLPPFLPPSTLLLGVIQKKNIQSKTLCEYCSSSSPEHLDDEHPCSCEDEFPHTVQLCYVVLNTDEMTGKVPHSTKTIYTVILLIFDDMYIVDINDLLCNPDIESILPADKIIKFNFFSGDTHSIPIRHTMYTISEMGRLKSSPSKALNNYVSEGKLKSPVESYVSQFNAFLHTSTIPELPADLPTKFNFKKLTKRQLEKEKNKWSRK